MNNLTRGGVAYNLAESPFMAREFYPGSGTGLYFMFSSEWNKDRFQQRMRANREKINSSLSKRFGFTIEMNALCDIKLYISIEKRGFLVIQDNGERFECLESITLDGNSLTMLT